MGRVGVRRYFYPGVVWGLHLPTDLAMVLGLVEHQEADRSASVIKAVLGQQIVS
jgi:hypothetical protein